MWHWMVVWLTCVMMVGGTLDLRILGPSRYSRSQMNCLDYPYMFADTSLRSSDDEGWRLAKKARMVRTTPKYRSNTQTDHAMARRIDFLLSNRDDILKEHAKLVQDINGLRQVMFVAPLADDSKDYDDSIFHEIIETTPTTSRPTTTKPKSKTGIPLIILGGTNPKHIVMSQPLKFQRQKINLVGTSITPLAKHPYPFVTAGSSRHPIRICMAPTTLATSTRRPSLWERLVKAILPR